MQVIAQSPAAAPITYTAAASGTSTVSIFNAIAGEPGAGLSLPLNLPGSNRLNGQPFRVRASGIVTVGAGTYTTTYQPLIYASTTAGFTASAAAAIMSAAAQGLTVSSAKAVSVPWAFEILAEGDSTSGLFAGTFIGLEADTTGPKLVAQAVCTVANSPVSVNFATEPPIQFITGVTTLGPVTGVTLQLTNFQLEA